jgi:hypothetical protein
MNSSMQGKHDNHRRTLTGSEQAIEEIEADGVEDTTHGFQVVAFDDFGGEQQADKTLLVVGALEELQALVHGMRWHRRSKCCDCPSEVSLLQKLC